MSDILKNMKYGRLALQFQQKDDDDLNNVIFELKEKYKISDDDLARINIAISVLMTRRMTEALK